MLDDDTLVSVPDISFAFSVWKVKRHVIYGVTLFSDHTSSVLYIARIVEFKCNFIYACSKMFLFRFIL